MVARNISTVSGSMDVDCCRGGGWRVGWGVWQTGVASGSVLHSCSHYYNCSWPTSCKDREKMRGWAYSGRKWRSPDNLMFLPRDWLHDNSVDSWAIIRQCHSRLSSDKSQYCGQFTSEYPFIFCLIGYLAFSIEFKCFKYINFIQTKQWIFDCWQLLKKKDKN